MIDRARESRNPKKVIRVTLMESYGEIGRVPVNLYKIFTHTSTSNSIFIYLLGAIICALGTLITFILMIRELLK